MFVPPHRLVTCYVCVPSQAGDKVTLLRKVDDQWFCGHVGGKEGIFPSSFIDVLVPIPSEEEIPDTVRGSFA